jgi:hypothetical protein
MISYQIFSIRQKRVKGNGLHRQENFGSSYIDRTMSAGHACQT